MPLVRSGGRQAKSSCWPTRSRPDTTLSHAPPPPPRSSLQDNDIDITRIDPPFRHRSIGQVKALTAQALMPLSVLDDKEYYISVPYGHLIQKQVGVGAAGTRSSG